MIVVRFDAGLGNQMLQYASYVALQQRYPGVDVKADIRAYNFARIHNGLELERLFPVKLDILFGKRTTKISNIRRYWHFAAHTLLIFLSKKRISKFRFVKDKGVFNEDLFHLDTMQNYYLEGQWGNAKYFENAADLVREHFKFKRPLDEANQRLLHEIQRTNSVSVHIRRGDYIGNTNFVELTKNNYYPDAFKYISGKTSNPVFYIFSDDADWCQQNLKFLEGYKHFFIKGNKGQESYKDLQLMCSCKHSVIANSTFSWWGAWLNKNENKIVICPKKLFYDENKNQKIVMEFYPATWMKL